MSQKGIRHHTVWRIEKKNVIYAMLGFILAAVEMYITSLAYFFPAYRQFFVYGVGPLFFIFLVFLLIFRKEDVKPYSWILMGLLFAVCLCGIVASAFGGSSMIHLLAWTISLLLIPVFFASLGPGLPLAAVKGISLYCRIILILYLFSVVLFRKTGMYVPKESEGARYHYFLGHVNSSVKLALPALAVFAVVDIWSRGKIRTSTWIFTILTLAAQVYTNSYVAAVGMCIYTLILLIFSKRGQLAALFVKWFPLAASGLIFGFIVLTQQSAFQFIVKFGARFDRSGSVLGRGLIWNKGLSAIGENKYGYGLFCDYSRLIRLGNYLPSSAHNLYIDAAIQTGIIGAALFVVFLFLLIKNMPSWEKWPVIPAVLFAYAVMWNFEPYFVDLYLQCTVLLLYLLYSLPMEKEVCSVEGE